MGVTVECLPEELVGGLLRGGAASLGSMLNAKLKLCRNSIEWNGEYDAATDRSCKA